MIGLPLFQTTLEWIRLSQLKKTTEHKSDFGKEAQSLIFVQLTLLLIDTDPVKLHRKVTSLQ